MAPFAARAAGLLLACSSVAVGDIPKVPENMNFNFTNGVIHLVTKPELHLNAKGGDLKPGDPLILWPCAPHSHELFESLSPQGLIKVKGVMGEDGQGGLCLQAKGGPQAGAQIVSWPCLQGNQTVPQEQWEHVAATGQLRLVKHPDLCMNVKGGALNPGAELVLWPCSATPLPHEQFAFKDGTIVLANNTDLHFNLAGGDLQDSTHVVLYNCHPGRHELFNFTADSRVHVQGQSDLCINAEGGIGAGQRLIVWPCAETPAANEKFKVDESFGFIYAVEQPNLVFNAKGGGMAAGDEVVLWPLASKGEL